MTVKLCGACCGGAQDAMLRQYQQEISALRAELAAPRGAASPFSDHSGGGWRCCSVGPASVHHPVALTASADLAAQVPTASIAAEQAAVPLRYNGWCVNSHVGE